MLTNAALKERVQAALESDPRVLHPPEIAIRVDEIGTVTLRGTVGSFRQRRAAVKDARAVAGVFEVIDKLELSVREADHRADEELRGQALQALMDAPSVLSDQVDAKVSERRVTLTGTVDSSAQSNAAFEAVFALDGISGVTNAIRVTAGGHKQ